MESEGSRTSTPIAETVSAESIMETDMTSQSANASPLSRPMSNWSCRTSDLMDFVSTWDPMTPQGAHNLPDPSDSNSGVCLSNGLVNFRFSVPSQYQDVLLKNPWSAVYYNSMKECMPENILACPEQFFEVRLADLILADIKIEPTMHIKREVPWMQGTEHEVKAVPHLISTVGPPEVQTILKTEPMPLTYGPLSSEGSRPIENSLAPVVWEPFVQNNSGSDPPSAQSSGNTLAQEVQIVQMIDPSALRDSLVNLGGQSGSSFFLNSPCIDMEHSSSSQDDDKLSTSSTVVSLSSQSDGAAISIAEVQAEVIVKSEAPDEIPVPQYVNSSDATLVKPPVNSAILYDGNRSVSTSVANSGPPNALEQTNRQHIIRKAPRSRRVRSKYTHEDVELIATYPATGLRHSSRPKKRPQKYTC